MASPIVITYKSSVYSTTNGSTTYTASPTWTPQANSLLIALVLTTASDTSRGPSANVTGHGLTYTEVTPAVDAAYRLDGGAGVFGYLSVWAALAGASPTSVAASAPGGVAAFTGAAVIELEVTGHDPNLTATGVFQQFVVASGSGTAAAATLAAAFGSDSRALGFVGSQAATSPTASGTWTIPSGASGNFSTPSYGAAGFYDNGTFNTAVAATVASAAWTIVGLEILAAPRVFYVIYPVAGGTPSATQIKAGQDSTGSAAVASGSQAAPTATGAFTFSAAASGLSAGTSYKIAFVWNDGADDSSVSEGSFTTTGGATGRQWTPTPQNTLLRM